MNLIVPSIIQLSILLADTWIYCIELEDQYKEPSKDKFYMDEKTIDEKIGDDLHKVHQEKSHPRSGELNSHWQTPVKFVDDALKVQGLMKWLHLQKSDYIDELYPYYTQQGLRGMASYRNITKDEYIAVVNSKIFISAEKVNLTEFYEPLQVMPIKSDVFNRLEYSFAVWLFFESEKGELSKYKAWIDTLPEKSGFLMIDFTDRTTVTLLEGSEIQPLITQKLDHVKIDYENLFPHFTLISGLKCKSSLNELFIT